MDTSLVLGRTGSFDEETGLFVLTGGYPDFGLTPETVRAIGKSRDGVEMNSTLPFMDNKLQTKNNVMFVDQTPGAFKDPVKFAGGLKTLIDHCERVAVHKGVFALDVSSDSMFYRWGIAKIAERRYVTEWMGLLPPEHVLKVILKQQGVATKRTILFATGVPPSAGGRMWLVSPHGFPWWGEQSKVVLDMGGSTDIEQAMMMNKFLFLLVPHAVPMISGHRKLQQDELNPRILCYDSFDEGAYPLEVDSFLAKVIQSSTTLQQGADRLRWLYENAAAGAGVAAQAQDFGVDHALALPENDEMW